MNALLCQEVPSDDGVVLKTDVYLPDGPGPFPAFTMAKPRHEPNPVVARNAVRHGPGAVSRVQLPVMPSA